MEQETQDTVAIAPDFGAKNSLIRIILPPNARAPPADFVYVIVK